MVCLSPKLYFFILLCTWISCQFFVPSDSRTLLRRAAGYAEENNSASNSTEDEDPCSEEKNGMYPCSSTITGNLLLMVFYGAILGVAAKCISDGAELLLDLGCSPSLVGGIVLPLLGAVPDSAIIIVSGLGDDAQTKLSVGMGTLAGSTIMLLTAAWAGSLVIGKCDLNAYGEAIEGSGYGKISCNKQGVTVVPSVQTAVGIMLLTSLSYFIVQGADWHFGPHNFGTQPEYVRKAALATMIICFIGFVAYLIFLFVDSKSAQMRADKHRQEMMQRKVLHRFVMMAKRTMPSSMGDQLDSGEDKAAQEAHVQKKYFKAWRLGAAMDKKEPSETDPIVPKEVHGDKELCVKVQGELSLLVKNFCFLMLTSPLIHIKKKPCRTDHSILGLQYNLHKNILVFFTVGRLKWKFLYSNNFTQFIFFFVISNRYSKTTKTLELMTILRCFYTYINLATYFVTPSNSNEKSQFRRISPHFSVIFNSSRKRKACKLLALWRYIKVFLLLFTDQEEEEEEEESFTHLTIKCVSLLVIGVGLVTIFADPMCDVLDSLTNSKNKSYIPISAFYVSFVVTPLCSNASELVSSLIFASKKKKENISMTFAQLYGAGTMNNTLCLGIFAALVYFRDLKWYYSAEVTVIIFVQWLVGITGFRMTYKLWMAILVGSLYVVSIGLVALLESSAIGWK
ncbi:unnamed protein product [Porites evermanni]|uniref:Sodium/calcium exchanger membrane region domain-containing protein n=1 Tax=Porites evermanni TaxID=104178 RepID=A0ABN8LPG3_9CNID|nr:unnamed protein product [Porites evermanni]